MSLLHVDVGEFNENEAKVSGIGSKVGRECVLLGVVGTDWMSTEGELTREGEVSR